MRRIYKNNLGNGLQIRSKLKIDKNSIRYKMSLLIVAIIVIAILIAGISGSMFLEEYYSNTKQAAIVNVYKHLSYMTEEDVNLEDSDNISKLNNECENHGVTLIVINNSGETVYEYGGGNTLVRRWQEMIFGPAIGVEDKSIIIDENKDYVMQSSIDRMTNQKYYELYGVLDSGNYFVIRASVENIRETLAITNRFYLTLGIIIVFILLVAILILANEYTKPILQLADISKRMSDLDFEAKYTGNHKDEIGVLGNSINEMSNKLEETISELKAANIELQKDIEKKIEIDEMRKDFISNVSHELKTPIALIQGYAEGLQENINDDPESTQFYCDVIMDEADKMNKMVKKLLALTQIEFGNKQVYVERFDLNEVIKGVLNSVKLKAEQENITIEYDDSKPVYVWADEFQIEEVIVNYISNAFNHIDENRRIIVKNIAKDDIVRLSVFNTGKQIPEEELDNVWIKFYKIDKARTREYGGNGIGLSIVKAIADSMNKKCGVINHEDGVEFWFELDCEASKEGL